MGTFFWLLVLVFVQSASTTLTQRGVYFFTEYQLGYRAVQNLLLAVFVGGTYVLGAAASHRLAQRLGERRTAGLTIGAQVLAMLAMGLFPRGMLLPAGLAVFSFFNGMTWPVLESYTGAGRSVQDASRAVGWFNITWSTASPMAVLISGWLIAQIDAGLFLVAAGMTMVSALLLICQPARPQHHPEGHPHRQEVSQLQGYRALLTSARWSLVGSYAMLFVLAPLMPNRFQQLGLRVAEATAAFCLLDASRAGAFLIMQRTHRWHGSVRLVQAAAAGLPAGFFLALFGGHLGVIVAGEVLFGLAMGAAYYAALYYALLLHHASVDAGGAHESLIGLGFVLGPMAALAGQSLGGLLAQPVLGLAGGVLPVILICLTGAYWALGRKEQTENRH